VIEHKKSEKRKGKEIRKKRKEITPSRDKVVTDYNHDDNMLVTFEMSPQSTP